MWWLCLCWGQEDSLTPGATLRGSSVWRVNTSCPVKGSAFSISCTSSDVKTSSFSSRRGKKCFLVYMTHSTVTTPRFLPASANPEKGNCKAVVKHTSYFCTLWALWGFDCILYYYFFNILLELLLTHSPPPNHPETTITLTAINQLSSKNTLFDCVTVRRCEDK